MAFCDFVVRYNPKEDSSLDLSKRILESVFLKRLRGKKPAVVFIGGDSGEGKSISALRLMQLLLEIQGIDIKKVLDDVNVYTPIEYPGKLDRLLFPHRTEESKDVQKLLKKTNVWCIHEAREVVKASNWRSFINTAISDVNAMSRSIKRLCTIIISQFIRDISTDIRYTLNFYCKVSRPLGKKARLYINVMWKDDRDLEQPRLRKRRLSGYIVYPNGRYKRYIPEYIELTKPDKDIVELFENHDREAKTRIIRSKLDRLMKEMKIDMTEGNSKVDAMVEWYSSNTDQLNLIGRRLKKGFRIKKEVKEMHGLTSEELKLFQEKLNIKMKEIGIIEKQEVKENEHQGNE